jgi:hypothetical protein
MADAAMAYGDLDLFIAERAGLEFERFEARTFVVRSICANFVAQDSRRLEGEIAVRQIILRSERNAFQFLMREWGQLSILERSPQIAHIYADSFGAGEDNTRSP